MKEISLIKYVTMGSENSIMIGVQPDTKAEQTLELNKQFCQKDNIVIDPISEFSFDCTTKQATRINSTPRAQVRTKRLSRTNSMINAIEASVMKNDVNHEIRRFSEDFLIIREVDCEINYGIPTFIIDASHDERVVDRERFEKELGRIHGIIHAYINGYVKLELRDSKLDPNDRTIVNIEDLLASQVVEELQQPVKQEETCVISSLLLSLFSVGGYTDSNLQLQGSQNTTLPTVQLTVNSGTVTKIEGNKIYDYESVQSDWTDCACY